MPRSQSMVLAGYFLSRLTQIDGSPPAVLGVQHWREAYELFRPSCGEGREATSFGRSLKNTRDAFDSHLDGRRVGWRDADGGPGRLSTVEAHVRDTWTSRSDEDLTEAVEELLTRPVHVARVGSGQPGQGGTKKLATGVVLVRSGARAPADEIHLKSPRRAGREKQIGDLAEALVRDHLMEMLGPGARDPGSPCGLGRDPGLRPLVRPRRDSPLRGGQGHGRHINGVVCDHAEGVGRSRGVRSPLPPIPCQRRRGS